MLGEGPGTSNFLHLLYFITSKFGDFDYLCQHEGHGPGKKPFNSGADLDPGADAGFYSIF